MEVGDEIICPQSLHGSGVPSFALRQEAEGSQLKELP